MCRVACPLLTPALTLLASIATAFGAPRTANAIASSTRTEYNFKETNCDFYCFWIPEANKKIDAETLKVFSVGASRCSHIIYGFAYLDEKLRIVPPTEYDFIPNDYYGNFKYMSKLRKKAPTKNVKLLYGIRMADHQRWIDNERLYSTVARKLVWHTRNINFDGMFLHVDGDLLLSANVEKFFKALGDALDRDGRFYNPHQPLSVVLAVKSEWVPHISGRITLIKNRLQAIYLWSDDTIMSADSYASSSAVSSTSSSLRGGGNGDGMISTSGGGIVAPTAAFVDPLSASMIVNPVDTIRQNSVLLAQKSGMGVEKVIVGLNAWTRSYVFHPNKIAVALATDVVHAPTTISVNATTQRRLKRASEDGNAEEDEGEAPANFFGHGHASERLGDGGPVTRRSDGRLSYYETCQIPGFVNATVKDLLAATASFVNANSSHWYSLNMPRSDSLGQKLKWIAKRGFGGIGLFSLQADDAFGACGPNGHSGQQFPLHQFVASHFRCRQPKGENTHARADALRPDACLRMCSVNLEVGVQELDFSFDNLDGGLCSHIVVSPLFLHTAGQVVTTETMRQLIDQYEEWAEESKPPLILSIGGSQNAVTWRNSLATAHSRGIAIENIVKAIEQVNAHGVEISWTRDGPETADDSAKLTSLVRELRQRLNASQEIFVGVVAAATFNRRYDFERIANASDYVVVQGHKFHFAKNAFTGHHSPLFADKDILSDPRNTIEGVMDIWRKKVVSRKLIVGVSAAPMSQKFLDKGTGIRSSLDAIVYEIGDRSDVLAWRRKMRERVVQMRNRADESPKRIGVANSMPDVCEIIKSNNTVHFFIDDIGVPYLIHGTDFIAYDNAHSMQTKAIWTTLNGFAGIAINSIGADNYEGKCPADRPFQLLRTIANAQMCPLCSPPAVAASPYKNKRETDLSTTTAIAPAMTQRCGRRPDGRLSVICHYDFSKRNALPLSEMPVGNCDEIVVEGAILSDHSKIVYLPTDSETTAMDEAALSKAVKKWVDENSVPVTESVACDMSEKDFTTTMNDKTRRRMLATSIRDHLESSGFTDVELKCDHLLTDVKISEKFNKFLGELHTALNVNFSETKSDEQCMKTIAIRIPVWRTNLTESYNTSDLNCLVSRVTIDQWPAQVNSIVPTSVFAIQQQQTNKNRNISALVNPLFDVVDDGHMSSTERNYALDVAIRGWIQSGLNRDRIVLFVAAYGIRIGQTDNSHPILSSAPENLERISYDRVCELVKNFNVTNRKTMLYNRVAGFSFIEGKKNRQISFENQDTVDYKVKYARREGLAGVALMNLNDDGKKESACGDKAFPILNALVHTTKTC